MKRNKKRMMTKNKIRITRFFRTIFAQPWMWKRTTITTEPFFITFTPKRRNKIKKMVLMKLSLLHFTLGCQALVLLRSLLCFLQLVPQTKNNNNNNNKMVIIIIMGVMIFLLQGSCLTDSTRDSTGSLHLLRFSLVLLSFCVMCALRVSTDIIIFRCICGDMDLNIERALIL